MNPTQTPLDHDVIEDEETSVVMNYPEILDRVKAGIIDSAIVLPVFMIIISKIFTNLTNVPDNARIIAFIFIVFLYEPLSTSLFGGTIGHFLVKIRVKRKTDEQRNIAFHFALMRFIFKILLGWISLLTIASTEKRLAIHDFIAGSVVIYK